MANHSIIMLGDQSVGKSVLQQRILSDHEVNTTFKDGFQVNSIDYHGCSIEIMRPHHQQQYYEIPEPLLENIHGVILVFDITKPETFYHLSYWFDTIRHSVSSAIPIVIVGTNVDARYYGHPRGSDVIGAEQGYSFVQNLREKYSQDIPYFELSGYRKEITTKLLKELIPKVCKRAKLRLISRA